MEALLLVSESCCCYQTTPAVKSQASLDLAAGEGLTGGRGGGWGGVGGVIIDRIESLHCLFKIDPDEKSPLNGQNVKSSAL